VSYKDVPYGDYKEAKEGKRPGWKNLPDGGLIPEAGTAVIYETGDWRSQNKPKWDSSKCINCMVCWMFCPDMSILVKDGKITGFDYKHCKGCGICAKVCPDKVKAITMVSEHEEIK
jgi:pyruvate ferredoxin oxidoreductase delta subunit